MKENLSISPNIHLLFIVFKNLIKIVKAFFGQGKKLNFHQYWSLSSPAQALNDTGERGRADSSRSSRFLLTSILSRVIVVLKSDSFPLAYHSGMARKLD